MGTANDRWFNEADSYQEAAGITLNDFYRAEQKGQTASPNGGIRNPVPTTLETGTQLVRFDGSARPLVAVQGKWWMTFGEYQRIEAHSRDARQPFAETFRALCAVPDEWSDMQVVVQARVIRPLRAYTGPTAPATGKLQIFETVGAAGGPPITQLFIPGLGDTTLLKSCLAITGQGWLPSWHGWLPR